MPALSPQFNSMITGSGLPRSVKTLLEEKKILTCEDFALLADAQPEVKSVIFPFLKNGGAELKEIEHQTSMAKKDFLEVGLMMSN